MGPEDWRGAPPTRYADQGVVLGSGGQGLVRKALDTKLRRFVAIKTIGVTPAMDQKAPLSEETLAAGRLLHPNILTVYDAWREPGSTQLHLVTPFVDGETFSDLIRATRRGRYTWSVQRLVRIFLQVCHAIAHAHTQGIAHRDIKSDNVLVTIDPPAPGSGSLRPNHEVWVIDWGIAGPVQADAQLEMKWRLPVRFGGTVGVMAPEVAGGRVRASLRADVYSLGCMLFEVLMRRRPYKGVPASMLRDPATQPAVPPIDDPRPTGLAKLCRRCMSPDPEARPASAHAVADAVSEWLRTVDRMALAEQAYVQARRLHTEHLRRSEVRAEVWGRLVTSKRAVHARSTDAERQTVWALEGRLTELDIELGELDARIDIQIQAALQALPDHLLARRLQADRLADRLQASSDLHPAQIRRLEVQLREADAEGQHRRLLEGLGALTLQTTRPARLSVRPIHRHGDRLVAGEVLSIGPADLSEHSLPHGLYEVRLQALDDGVVVRLPLQIERGQHTILGRGGQCDPVLLPRASDLDANATFIPRGHSWMGGDLRAQGDRLPEARRVWVDQDLVVRNTLVTVRDWCRYLHALHSAGDTAALEHALPRHVGGRPALVPGPTGAESFVPAVYDGEDSYDPDWPIFGVPGSAVHGFIDWWSHRTRHAWRLPREDEWIRIARGADRRSHPWGYGYEPGWAALLDAQPASGRRPFRVGRFPRDCSPFGGIVDLAGGLMERMGHGHVAEPRVQDGVLEVPPLGRVQSLRGGNWFGAPGKARLAGRTSGPVDSRSTLIGFRMVRTLPREPAPTRHAPTRGSESVAEGLRTLGRLQ